MAETKASNELVLAKSSPTEQDAIQEKSQPDSSGANKLAMYVEFRRDDGTSSIIALNRAARNNIVRENPGVIASNIAHSQRQQAKQQGLYKAEGSTVSWDESLLPFHLEYTIRWANHECRHLVSVRNRSLDDPAQYAKDIIRLAKSFLGTGIGSTSPHLPFRRSPTSSNPSHGPQIEEAKDRQTIELAHIINSRYNTLSDIDIQTAESTAKLVNADKINPGLLTFLTSSGPKRNALPASNKTKLPGKVTKDKSKPRLTGLVEPSQAKSNNQERRASLQKPPEEHVIVPDQGFKDKKATEEVAKAEISCPTKRKKKKNKKYRKQKTISNETVEVEGPIPSIPGSSRAIALSESVKVSAGSEIQSTADTAEPLTSPSAKMNTSSNAIPSKEENCQDKKVETSSSSPNTSLEQFPIPSNPAGTGLSDPQTNISNKASQSQPHLENSPITDMNSYYSISTSPNRALKWAYATHTEVDVKMYEAGIWLWEKPRTYLQNHRVPITESSQHGHLLPVFVSHETTGDTKPVIESDGSKTYIVPHLSPWPDVRSMPHHPDFLPSWKLAEYQACEAAGYRIWRHDRDYLYCRKDGCGALLADTTPQSIICSGCGPKTVIRYCSFEHQVEDIPKHAKECGHPDLVIKALIDHTTLPARLSQKFPSIREKHGFRSEARQLQQVYAMHSKGHYTLFDPEEKVSYTLSWPSSDPNCKQMDARIERLLNIIFLDTRDPWILSYLYRLLRELLKAVGAWDLDAQNDLNQQFCEEVAKGSFNPARISDQPPCECEWVGFQPRNHGGLLNCPLMFSNDFGPAPPRLGLRAYVERLECRYWILRAARQQHPTEEVWQRRAAGYGFPGMRPGFVAFKLGPGWTGWGGVEDNICSPN